MLNVEHQQLSLLIVPTMIVESCFFGVMNVLIITTTIIVGSVNLR